MAEPDYEIFEESAILARLAQVHKVWRDQRPPTVRSSESHSEMAFRVAQIVRNPEPQDIVAIREASVDPLATAISSQLSVVGWRLYAKGGISLLTSVYRSIEIEHHPGFASALSKAWRKIGFPNDPRGVWHSTGLL